jgi:hypothetical protein
MLRDLLEQGSVIEIVGTFLALALIAASVLSIFFIIWGGISFILSAGNEDKIRKAVHTIRYAIIGLVVTFIAFFAVSFIANLLDIPFELSFSTVMDLMRELFQAMQ